MAQFLAPLINEQQEDDYGAPLTGGTISVYLAGTSTPATTTSDKAGLVPNTWPIVLNTLGVNNQGAVWITGGATYKYVFKNASGVVQRTIDNISGINDTTVSVDQWVVYQATPTYVSATSFSVVGDQTQTFQVNRRVRTTNTGGLVYSTISASAYSAPNTTVTVINDSGALDAGLSAVAYGIVSPLNSSVLPAGIYAGERIFAANGSLLATDVGKNILITATGVTITLPLIAVIPLGSAYHFISGSRFTIQRSGADVIGNLITTVSSLAASGNFTLTATAAGWQVGSGYSRNVQAVSGYSFLPNGSIMQWGSNVQTLNGASQGSIAFPTPFPTAFFTVVATNGDGGVTLGQPVILGTPTTSSFNFQYSGAPGAVSVRTNFVAYGN